MEVQAFVHFLVDLREEADARVCGSFARGDYDLRSGFLSDIDFVVPAVSRSDAWGVLRTDRPIDKAVAVFARYGVPWDSILPGQISSPRDTTTLPRPVEVMETSWVEVDPSLPENVLIFGMLFLTYRSTEWADAIAERFER